MAKGQKKPVSKKKTDSSAKKPKNYFTPQLNYDNERAFYIDFTRDRFHGCLPVDENGNPESPGGMLICRKCVVLLFSIVFGVAMVVAGWHKMDDCPAQPMIPKYLIGEGPICFCSYSHQDL